MRKFTVVRDVIVTTAAAEALGVPRQKRRVAFTVTAPTIRRAGTVADRAKLAVEVDRGHWSDPEASLTAMGVFR